MENFTEGREKFSQSCVLVEDIHPNNLEIDFQHNLGTLCIVEYSPELGFFIEWHQCGISIESHFQEWAIVQDVANHTEDNTQNSKKPIVRIKIDGIEVEKNKQNVIIQGKEMKVTFYFQRGNPDSFINAMSGIPGASVNQSTKDSYVSNKQEVKVLERSLSELNLFTDDQTRSTVLGSFMKRLKDNPYETTMDTFSKVTNKLMYVPLLPSEEELAEDQLTRTNSGDESTEGNTKFQSDEYEMITKGLPLPVRTIPPRGPKLVQEFWDSCFDDSGRIKDTNLVREIIFNGGISPVGNLRKEVWKYLLDYYPWDSTAEERLKIREEKNKIYLNTKLQWQLMSDSQIERFSAYKIRVSLIDKDVHRTDRNLQHFSSDDNPNLTLLRDILITYVMYNFDLGYVQGMSDLLSPLLIQMEDEADTFWCFVGFMNKVSRNFELEQDGMKEQLQHLYSLLCVIEPELASSLDQDSKGMSFCFRWLLVWFKREFNYGDIYSLWEVLWTDYLCKNYHLLVCIAILDNEKETIISNGYGFTEVLKHVNELANTMNVDQILAKANGIYLQVSCAVGIPANIREILGLEPLLPQLDNTDSKLEKDEKSMEEISESTKSTIDYVNEIIFDQSLSMQYL